MRFLHKSMAYIISIVLIGLAYWAYKVIYSVYFSPLKDIPGPFILQVFPFYFSITLALGNNHELLLDWHLKYGRMFRGGWDVVIFADAGATVEIMSTHAYPKAPNYAIFGYFGENVFSTRDRQFHSQRSKLVAPGLHSVDSMRAVVANNEIAEMCRRMDAFALDGSACNMFLMLHNMTYDVIGRLVFGQSFNMLRTGNHPIVGWMIKGLSVTMLGLAIPAFKLISNPYLEKVRLFIGQSVDRLRPGDHEPIIARYLNAQEPRTGSRLGRDAVISEGFVLLLAGTESTSNTMLWVLYHLARHPKVKARVLDELAAAFPDRGSPITHVHPDDTPYFHAVIRESMRLLPAVSGVGLRQVPPEGRKIMGHFLPSGVSWV